MHAHTSHASEHSTLGLVRWRTRDKSKRVSLSTGLGLVVSIVCVCVCFVCVCVGKPFFLQINPIAPHFSSGGPQSPRANGSIVPGDIRCALHTLCGFTLLLLYLGWPFGNMPARVRCHLCRPYHAVCTRLPACPVQAMIRLGCERAGLLCRLCVCMPTPCSVPHYPPLPAPRHWHLFNDRQVPKPLLAFNEQDVSDKPAWIRSLPRCEMDTHILACIQAMLHACTSRAALCMANVVE